MGRSRKMEIVPPYGSIREQLAESLRILCEREGGKKSVADAIGSSPNTINQLIHGYRDAKGNPRVIGARLQRRLDDRYPGWHTLAWANLDRKESLVETSFVDAADDTEEPTPVSLFNAGWVTARGYRAKHLALLRAVGRGMEPTLYHGDLVLINLGDTEPVDDAVFAVKTNGTVVLRRLVRQGKAWRLHRDNPDQNRYPSAMLEEGDELLGRIVMRLSEIV